VIVIVLVMPFIRLQYSVNMDCLWHVQTNVLSEVWEIEINQLVLQWIIF